jgi:hypothetical protein
MCRSYIDRKKGTTTSRLIFLRNAPTLRESIWIIETTYNVVLFDVYIITNSDALWSCAVIIFSDSDLWVKQFLGMPLLRDLVY